MAEPFTGEIKMFAFNFNPKNWAKCDGQLLPVRDNVELYSLIGITFGGNGTTDFALPDFRGRCPIHNGRDEMGNYYEMGEKGGYENIPLHSQQMPRHNHTLNATSEVGDGGRAKTTSMFATGNALTYGNAEDLTSLSSATSGGTGESETHYNVMPSIVINFCIALQGTYPSRN